MPAAQVRGGQDRFRIMQNGRMYCRVCCPDGEDRTAFMKLVAAVELEAERPNDPRPTITRDSAGLAKAIEHLGLEFRYNNRSAEPEVLKDGQWRELEDNYDAALNERIADNCLFRSNNRESPSKGRAKFGQATWKQAVLALSHATAVDPFLSWLDSLPPWDGMDRIDVLLQDLFEVPEDFPPTLLAWAARHLTLGAVTRTVEPGHKLDAMPVLIGDQGIGKSTVPASLFPRPFRDDWFSDNLSFGDSDIRQVEALLGSVITADWGHELSANKMPPSNTTSPS